MKLFFKWSIVQFILVNYYSSAWKAWKSQHSSRPLINITFNFLNLEQYITFLNMHVIEDSMTTWK